MLFSGLGSVKFTVVLSDLQGLFQPKLFYDLLSSTPQHSLLSLPLLLWLSNLMSMVSFPSQEVNSIDLALRKPFYLCLLLPYCFFPCILSSSETA